MSLDSLPIELLIMVIRKLDVKSISNLYDAGNKHIRNIIRSQGVIKECHFSLNTLATAKSLKLQFFRDISAHLQELNMSAVPDLKKTSLLPAMKKLSSLSTLNVSYTNITILDLLDIYQVCPTIKNISIDYQFHKTGAIKAFPVELLQRCQNVFKNFENINFVGSADNLLYSELPQLILQKAKLNNLTYIVSKADKMFTFYKYTNSQPICCNKFSLFFPYWRKLSAFETVLNCPKVLQKFAFEYEFVFISRKIFCSPLLKDFFSDKFNIDADPDSCCLQTPCYGSVAFMIWNKATTVFDNTFFYELLTKLKNIFPYGHIPTHIDDNNLEVPENRDWVCVTHPLLNDGKDKNKNEPALKKRRIASSCVVLDYDELLKGKQSVQLSICFYDHVKNPVTLSSNSSFLKKLTFLSLGGSVRFSGEFFNILFRCCENLITLNVEAPSVSPCAAPISRTIPLSRSVKNLRLVDKQIDFETLFSSLGQCKSLENIEIQDSSNALCGFTTPETLLKQCDNLFNLSIHVHMSETARTKHLQMLNETKLKYNKHHLHIELISLTSDIKYTYDPFVEVFRLSQINVII